jgi:DNA-binding NarL/FixJ family response regulator
MDTREKPIRVFVVDDNYLVCEAVQKWMTEARGVLCVGSAGDTDSARTLLNSRAPDLVLLDINMPGSDPFGFLAWVVQTHPHVKVLMLSGLTGQEFIDRSLQLGAAGYLVKGESMSGIVEYVRRAMSGEIVLSATSKSWLLTPD